MEPEKKGIDLALIFGGKGKDSKGSKPDSHEGDERDEDTSSDEDDELPPGFEEAAIEAFPDLDGDMDRLKALKRAIHACTGSYD